MAVTAIGLEGRKDRGRFPVELLDINPNEEVSSLKTSLKGSRVMWAGAARLCCCRFFCFFMEGVGG